jgi:hypothetical protein
VTEKTKDVEARAPSRRNILLGGTTLAAAAAAISSASIATTVSLPGTGIPRPETASPGSPFSANSVSAETGTRATNAASSGPFNCRTKIYANARLRGGGCSRHRTGLSIEIPWYQRN